MASRARNDDVQNKATRLKLGASLELNFGAAFPKKSLQLQWIWKTMIDVVDVDDDGDGSSSVLGGGKLAKDEYREWGWTEEDWQNSPAEFLHFGGLFFVLHFKQKQRKQQQFRKELGATFPGAFAKLCKRIDNRFKTIPRHSWMQFSLARM